eukprot:TRINITY_DN4470_c0_g2_i2.p1 TRINITY_DN4470_c0_g2~~TRINITY_DN4470_c0_g2_i2.p1  ORF type:complete len:509 (+),score=41.87 TRINITY_DN4470_c0_g2_i2:120-1529(+)
MRLFDLTNRQIKAHKNLSIQLLLQYYLLGTCVCDSLLCEYEEIEQGCELDINNCGLLSLLDEVAGVNTEVANNCDHRYLMSVQELRNQSMPDQGSCYFHKCGGSLIAPNLIITAAHCIYQLVDEHISGNVSNQFFVARAPKCRHHAGEGRFPVKQFWIYPDYDDFNLLHDIAVLQIEEDLGPPYALYDLPNTIKVDELSIIGWGDIDANETTTLQPYNSRHMRIAYDLKIVLHDACQQKLRSVQEYSFVFEQQMLCAEGTSVDACRGDSGGPLIYYQGGQAILIGITSWGPRDSQCITYQNVTRPGIYTRVQFYKDWIDNIVELTAIMKQTERIRPNVELEQRLSQQQLQSLRTLGTGSGINMQVSNGFSNRQQQQKEEEEDDDDKQNKIVTVQMPTVQLSPVQLSASVPESSPAYQIKVPFIRVEDNLLDGIEIPIEIQIITNRSSDGLNYEETGLFENVLGVKSENA